MTEALICGSCGETFVNDTHLNVFGKTEWVACTNCGTVHDMRLANRGDPADV